MEMRLLTVIIVCCVCSGQAAPIMEENAVIVAESESADNPATTSPHISTSTINSDTASDSNFHIAEKQEVDLSTGGVFDEEAAAAAAAERMATAIVAPLTHIAHVTYDSEPVTHKPNADKPLFHREPHDELIAL